MASSKPSDKQKQEVLDERAALIEMYKAGFLDAYKMSNRIRTSKEWTEMNKNYKKCFMKRFKKAIKMAQEKK